MRNAADKLILDHVFYARPGTRRNILSDVTAAFETGKLYVIMGKPGAGKSTLLSLIAGFGALDAGRILYNGRDLRTIRREDFRARDIGVIFHRYNLLPDATALDNVLLAMNISGIQCADRRGQAYQMLEMVGINKAAANRAIRLLSAGEQRRVVIVRAMSHDPGIVLADEPAEGMDERETKMALEIFRVLAHREQRCVILMTRTREAASAADEIWGLNKGILTFVKENADF